MLASQFNRRRLLTNSARFILGCSTLAPLTSNFGQTFQPDHEVTVTDMEVIVVNVTQRTKWIFVLLTANNGVTGLGEASLGRRNELNELDTFFRLVEGQSPFDINQYRTRGWPRASAGNRAVATAFSAIEHALWDIVGKTLSVPVYQLFGGKLRDSLPVYANINRATSIRTPEGFAEKARQAVADGFKAIKAAPFDGFPPLTASPNEISEARQLGVDCVFAIREAIGDDIAIKIDAHSFFDVELSISVADQLLPANLSWYEEPIAPTQTTDTKRIHDSISQTMAGGEFLFGVEGFAPLCEQKAVDIIMPDIKHCGGLLEAIRIAAVADANGIKVSPHNPSGPVSTAASVALCAALPNFDILEYQWGEQPWRSNLVAPSENFVNGTIEINDSPGFGIVLNEQVLAEHRS